MTTGQVTDLARFFIACSNQHHDLSMKRHRVCPVAASRENGDQDYMLHDQHPAAGLLRFGAVKVNDIGEGPHPSRGKDHHHGTDGIPEEKTLDRAEKAGHPRVVPLETVEQVNGNDGRQPVAGGKVVNEAVEDNGGFLYAVDHRKYSAWMDVPMCEVTNNEIRETEKHHPRRQALCQMERCSE